MNFKKIAEIAFLVVGFLTVLEFVLLQGMFTWLMVVISTMVVGLVNIILCLKDKEWNKSLLYLLCSIALCMGYIMIIIG